MSEALKRAREAAIAERDDAAKWVDLLDRYSEAFGRDEKHEELLSDAKWRLAKAQAVLEAAIAAAPQPEIQIPNDVKFLTAGVDVADGRFEVAVYGWTADGEPAEVERFVTILDDYPLSDKRAWDALEAFLKRPFRRDDGLYLHVQAACINSGGAFTGEVYDFAKKHVGRRWWAVKARSNRKGERTAVWPEAPVKTSTGALLYVIDFDRAHEEMAERFSAGGVLTDSVVFAYVAARGLAAVPGPIGGWSEPELKSAVDALEEKVAAEAPATKVRIDLGDKTIETRVSVEDGKRIMARQRREKSEPIRIPIEFNTSDLDEALRNAAKDRVNIEINLDRPSITVDGNPLDAARVVKCLLAQDVDFATGGVVTGKPPFGLVGEHASETIMSTTQAEELRVKTAELLKAGVESAKVVADEVDEAAVWSNHRREWSLFGVPDSDNDFPLPGHRRFDLGDWVEVNVLHSGDVHCAVGQGVEITMRKGGPSFFRILFPHGFLFQDDLFLAENMSRARQEAIVK